MDAPLLLQLFPGVSFAPQVLGPKVLGLADFASSAIPGSKERLRAEGGLLRRYGFHDETTADYLMHLSKAHPFPDLTVAYFPNNDFVSHDAGPESALSVVKRVDECLAEFIASRGGVVEVLEEFTIVVVGDHSQCDLIRDEGGRGIDLDEVLAGFQRAKAGQPWIDDDALMICPNMRSCHIYVQERSSDFRDQVIERLLNDPRIDQVFWRDSSWDNGEAVDHVDPRSDVFHVDTSDHGRLTFRHVVGTQAPTGHDIYGTAWIWDGDLGGIDANATDSGLLKYGRYPNAFERIATGFSSRTADLWITAKNGCEFCIGETSIHDGGSHGGAQC